MKKFAVYWEPYMHEDSSFSLEEAESLYGLLKELFSETFWEDEKSGTENISEEEFIKNAEDANGDGMQFISILDLETGKKVFG